MYKFIRMRYIFVYTVTLKGMYRYVICTHKYRFIRIFLGLCNKNPGVKGPYRGVLGGP